MSDVSLCYPWNGQPAGDQLGGHIRAEGWHREIQTQLHAALAVVVLLSAKSGDSDYLLQEAEYGKREEILPPAFIEDVAFPSRFGRIQTENLIGWAGEIDHSGLTQLLDPPREHLTGHLSDTGSGSGSPLRLVVVQ